MHIRVSRSSWAPTSQAPFLRANPLHGLTFYALMVHLQTSNSIQALSHTDFPSSRTDITAVPLVTRPLCPPHQPRRLTLVPTQILEVFPLALGIPSKTNPDGSFRYKAVTREVLMGDLQEALLHSRTRCFVLRQSARSKQFDPDEFGANAPSIQARTETLEHYLKRATHLQLDNLKLSHTFPDPDLAVQNGERVPNDNTFSLAKALRVLYLHDNNLTRIDTLSFCANALTHLYLQCNHIERIENIHDLVNLEKLYLTGNMIQVLEGFVKEEEEQQQQQHQQQLEESEQSSRKLWRSE